MSYEISLIKLIENRDKALYGRLLVIRKQAEALLVYTQGKFPYYTPHGFLHSSNVEENLNWLIPDNVKEKLNNFEIFFLLVAAWLHDWGMIGSEQENPFKIREEHHIRTEHNFEKLFDKLYLNEHEARIIGRICKGHRKVDLTSVEYNDIIFGHDIKIKQRLLAALLRLADECDITANRTPEIIYYSINPKDASEEEFKKHLSISGIGQLQERHKIYVSAIARDPKGARTLREAISKIQHELDAIKGILGQNDIPLDIVELNLETRGFIDRPIAFEINKSRIVELLIGKHLYSNHDVAVRELIQNSIDSCKIREQHEIGFKGKVSLIKDDNTLIVEDNGLGMGYFEAKQYLSVIGSTFYNSEAFRESIKDKPYDPIAQFGIGILSCFLISKGITIETMKQGEEPCKFSIESISEEWKYEKGLLQTPGTRITLVLDKDGEQISIKDALYRYFISPEIDIEFQDTTGGREKFNSSWSADNINRFLMKNLERDGERFNQILESHTDDYDLFFGYAIGGWSLDQIILFCHGIFVGRFSIHGLGYRYLVCVNLKKNIIDLQISRENVIENDKWNLFIYSLFNSIFSSAEEHFKDTQKFIDFISGMLENRLYIRKKAGFSLLHDYPFLKLFFDRALFPVMTEGILSYINLKEALDADRLIIYTCCSNNHLEEIKFVCTLSDKKNLLFNPYEMPKVDLSGNGENYIDLIGWMAKDAKKECSWLNLRKILIESSVPLGKTYPEILPSNIRLVKFPEYIKPLVVVEKYAVIKTEKEPSMGKAYWANILLWQSLLEEKRKEHYFQAIREAYDKRYENLTIMEEQVVLVDASDEFVAVVLQRAGNGSVDKETTDKIYRYFRYLSYLPLAIQDLSSCLIFIEILDRLEYDISKSINVARPKEIFSRMRPFKLYFQYFDKFGLNFDTK